MVTPSLGFAAPLSSFRLHLRHFPCLPTLLKHPSSPTYCSDAAHVVSIATDAPLMDRHCRRRRPSLEVIGGARDFFLPALKTLALPYDPFPFIGWNGHVETIFASLFRSRPDVRYRRECLRMTDDGVVALDWVSGDIFRLPADNPLLILLVCLRFTSLYLQLLTVLLYSYLSIGLDRNIGKRMISFLQ